MPPKPLEGDFLLVPPLLFVGALFGGPFSSWQVASSSTSPTSDAAAPDVDVPPPIALSGASPSLHARHEEQRFLFLIESFEWLHRWHGHDEARRVADRSVGILLREGESEIERRGRFGMQIEEKIIVQFLIYIRDLQYRVKIPPPTSIGGKAKEIRGVSGHRMASAIF
jgi:hypothetical protein